jgi:hypothetical protein
MAPRDAAESATFKSGWTEPVKVKLCRYIPKMPAYRTELEEARLQLSEGLLRLWEQTDLVDELFRNGRPTESAQELLASMQKTIDELRLQVDFLMGTIGRSD